jgi:biopolymer transport protein ExbD
VQPEESIHVKIEGEGQFVVDRTPMTLESMGGYVKGRMDQNPNKPVIIETDPEVPYYVMIEVFDLLRFLEVEHVSVPTKSERELWKQFFQ